MDKHSVPVEEALIGGAAAINGGEQYVPRRVPAL